MMSSLLFQNIRIDDVSAHFTPALVHVLRLDLIHPVISGNKWFKLKEYLAEARAGSFDTIASFGGAYANHIVATAAAAKEMGMASIGFIRGEAAKELSHTLLEAKAYGMQLVFLSREDYREKKVPDTYRELKNIYWINEGGYGPKGAAGAASIALHADYDQYTHVLAAVGTGTMLAGLIEASNPAQSVIGISVLKNNWSIVEEINALLSAGRKDQFRILFDYHGGGYAKHSPALISFLNQWFEKTGIPSDFVYTGKLFFAFEQLHAQNFFPDGSKILLLQSGGLQGNRSLSEGTLIF